MTLRKVAPLTDRSCPCSGIGLGDALDRFRTIPRPSSGTSVMLGDDRVTRAREAGVHDGPRLFGLGEPVVIGGAGWRAVGQARFSADEGDVVLQAALDLAGTRSRCGPGHASDLPPPEGPCDRGRDGDLRAGESHRFLNLAGHEGDLLSRAFREGGQAWIFGRWLDPFELRPGERRS